MTAIDGRAALVRTLREMVGALDAPHADVAARIQGVLDGVDSAPGGEVPERLLRRVRRLRQGTMGSLSDVVFAELRDGRWIPDDARNERWAQLGRRLRDDVALLPPPTPADLFLVSDRVRECWFLEPSSAKDLVWSMEVFPPVWLDGQATTDEVHLRSTGPGWPPGDGEEVAVVSGGAGRGEQAVGTGRVFRSRAAADAAAASFST